MSLLSETYILYNGVKIPKIGFGTWQISNASAYDAVLVCEFMSWGDLRIYQEHPLHKEVAAYIAKVREERAVVDFDK